MEYKNILYEAADGIAKITINRPGVLNALNAETARELSQALTRVRVDDSVRVLILTGAGEKAFIAGGDVNEIKESLTKGKEAARDHFASRRQDLMTAIERLGKPVIAAVNGFALGGGSEVAQACHLVIASENARFGHPEINLGFNPCWGATVRLPHQVGLKKALEMILTGEIIDAKEAHRIGLVNAVVPPGDLMAAAVALAEKIAKKPGAAVRLCIDSVLSGQEMSQAEALANEASLFGHAATTEDAMEGLTAFLEKRQPVFKHK